MRVSNLQLFIIIALSLSFPLIFFSAKENHNADTADGLTLSPQLIRGYTYEIVKLPERTPTGEDMYRGKFYQGHVFYQDEEGDFKKVDTRLTFNQETNRWEQNKASYNVSLPEYSDGEIDFRDLFEGKDQTISMRPVASHVKGELVTEGEYADRAVKYAGAFEEGVDLLLFANNEHLDKLVVINEKPLQIPEQTTFDFELSIPEGAKAFQTRNLLTSLSGRTVEGDEVLIGNGPTEKESTILKRFRVWDSAGEGQFISVRFYEKDGRLYLQKILPKEFLENAKYPVYTDTTVSFFTHAADGRIQNFHGAGVTWDSIRNASSGSSVIDAGSDVRMGSHEGGQTDQYFIDRGFFPFNTSSIPSNAAITAVSLNLFVTSKSSTDNDGNDFIAIVQTSQANETALAVEDFDQCGAIDNPVEAHDLSERKDITGIATNAYLTFNFNATGRSWVKRSGDTSNCGTSTGWTCLGGREGHDVVDDPIADNTNNEIRVGSSERSGTSGDPYLEVTYSIQPSPATGPDNIKTRIKGGAIIKGGVNFK